MAPIPLILTVFAFVFFVVATLPFAQIQPLRDRLVSAGLAVWVLVQILGYSGVMAR